MSGPQQGDWVQVWALVEEVRESIGDVVVRLESHNEHYTAYVRTSHVETTSFLPPDVEMCSSLVRSPGTEEGTYVLCEKHHSHPGEHRRDTLTWVDEEQHGYMEHT